MGVSLPLPEAQAFWKRQIDAISVLHTAQSCTLGAGDSISTVSANISSGVFVPLCKKCVSIFFTVHKTTTQQ